MKYRYLLIVLLYFCVKQLQAQINDITFRRISPPGGFSFQAVHTIKQDMLGYIWMGSSDGILRYDSKEVINFKHITENINSLPSNRVSGIAIDATNNIWVSTDKGLCLFNHKLQQFEPITYTYENGKTASSKINSISLDGTGRLWICDNKYIGYLNRNTHQLERIIKEGYEAPVLLYNDETNRLWLGTQNGTVYLVLADKDKVVKKIDGPGSQVQTIFASNSKIWVGYNRHGARLYNLDGTLMEHYLYSLKPAYDFANANVRKIWKDTRGRIWIGSYYGLFLNVGTELFRFNPNEYTGLPHNSIYDISEDKQGGIWVSTWSGGVAYLHHSDNKFSTYRHSLIASSISDNVISSFTQTPNGDMFVGTEQDGLNKFNNKTKKFQKIQVLENGGVLDIKSLCTDDYGGLWIGSAFNGAYYRKQGQKKFIHFSQGKNDGQHLSGMQVYSICKSDSGMWMGTNAGGLNFYNFNTKQISIKSLPLPLTVLNNTSIRCLKVDSRQNLWIATLNGMFRLHLPSGKLCRFDTNTEANYKTKTSAFYYVNELSDGKIWMGTRAAGIHIYNPEKDSLSHFNAHGLLSELDVYGIIERFDNSVWITSNKGLIVHYPEKNISQNFDMCDGIQGNLFNPGAIFKDSGNNLYFGGTNGFTKMGTNRIKKNELAPKVLISKVVVNKRNIAPIQHHINQFDELVLSPNETTIKFHFSADNYLLPQKNKFKYRLTNYFDEWVDENKSGTADFINLPAGKYIFEVKACNNDGVWNETPATLPIVIKQFWYKSNLALFIYTIASIIILLLFYRFSRERSKLKKTILIAKIKHENEENLNEMRLRFFTNISHEFRTPLTLINGPIKNLLKENKLSTSQHDQLTTVKRNANRLLQLINQIMDFRKVENGKAKLNISKIEFIDFVNERILNFSEEAKLKNITFLFKHENNTFLIEADEEKLDKIIFNILSNAFKFTPVNGKINVAIKNNQEQKNYLFANQLSFGKIENEDFVEIQVVDNGFGIDSEDLPKIFDRFEQATKNKNTMYSTGIGLNLCKDFTLMHRGAIIVQSTPGEGTSFSIRIPTKQKAQKIVYESTTAVKNRNPWQTKNDPNLSAKAFNEKIKVLVIEDNKDLQKYIVTFLQKYYTLISAINGKQGLEILKAENIQLVISDVMMPEMDGFEFCQILKSQIETSHIPIILLTALTSAENTSTGLNKGADAYITKPFDENVLIAQIDNLLLQRKRIQENYTQNFISKQPTDMGSLDNYFLNKVNTVIEKNIENEDFSVEMLAAELGFSRSQLHRKLKQTSNYSCSEYIMMVRIRKATSLLALKKYSIDEVAFKAGFSSHSYFSRSFKKFLNKSPMQYLNEL